MNKLRRIILWAALALIISSIFLSIYGAFLGAARAKGFFNSIPLSIYWLALACLLVLAIAAFQRLLHVPGLLLTHLGCVLILAGSIWGSDRGHSLQKRLVGLDKIPQGQMIIFEGASEKHVKLEANEQTKELPFSIKLKDFRLEHYEPGYLLIETRGQQRWQLPVEIGAEYSLGPDFGTITVTKRFKNFKITFDGTQRIPIDSPKAGSNPALEVQITDPNGAVTTKYVFERFGGHVHPEDKLLLSYHRIISDFISEIQIIKDGKVLAEESLEVNHPVYFGGYHFYQHAYDDKAGEYTILMVTSDTGLKMVYLGYLMLCVGVFWQFWLRPILRKSSTKE
ncbi:MAG: cytochrome c biogenesis protein ResB [Planctomycetota bacterium]|nr:MAG: cytochrome c biogenesis protein ResB [Planctomycetota bacterium]